MGGSQGAEIFGVVIPAVIKRIKDAGYEIKINHQCILEQKNSIIEFYEKNNIKNYVFDFDKNILKLVSNSSLAISRCGASTTAELTHPLTPFIADPLSNENLFNLIIEIIRNKNKLEKIRNNMKKSYNKNVYSNIENELKEFI